MRTRRRLRPFATVFIVISLAAAGILAGWLLADKSDYNKSHSYPLLDPSVSSPDIVHQEVINFDPLRQDLKPYLASLNISHSFYFEYLPNGVNIRDSADSSSVAASLIKIPVVMDLYKLAEQKKLNLDDTVVIKQSDINTDPLYGNPSNLQPGETISLRTAAQLTLHNSDDTSVTIIKRVITPLVTDATDSIQSLDISYTYDTKDPNNKILLINSLSYSSILKCLYYSCFNTPKDSSEMLTYLTGSIGHQQLMAGVPANLKVAHKVGSYTNTQSDCGIVYQPSKPYLVCLMFFNYPASDSNKIDSYFETVSKMIHDYIVQS